MQVSGRVGDDSAVSIGKWLGADSMVLFRIDAPTWRERLLARFHEKMPSIVVSSKIVSVESGEVLYHDIVTAMPVPEFGKKWSDSSIDYDCSPRCAPLSIKRCRSQLRISTNHFGEGLNLCVDGVQEIIATREWPCGR